MCVCDRVYVFVCMYVCVTVCALFNGYACFYLVDFVHDTSSTFKCNRLQLTNK